MPKPLDPRLVGRIAEYSTYPVWMAEIQFPSGTERWASAPQDITWKLNTWVGNGLRISDINENNPDAKVYLEVPDQNRAITEKLHADGIEHPATVYRTWGESVTQSVYTDDEMLEVFTGVLAGAPQIGLILRFELVSTNTARLFPFLRFNPPTNSMLWPVDQDVSWNGKKIRVVE